LKIKRHPTTHTPLSEITVASKFGNGGGEKELYRSLIRTRSILRY
jgi:hypothetical protein